MVKQVVVDLVYGGYDVDGNGWSWVDVSGHCVGRSSL